MRFLGLPSPTPDCTSDTYANPVFSGVLEPGGADPVCGCDCGDPTGLVFDTSSVLVEYFGGDSTCSGAPSWSTFVSTGACNALPQEITPNIAYMRGEAIAVTGGSCAPQPSESIPRPDPAVPAVICDGAEPGDSGCEDGQACVSPPELSDDLCIWRVGEHECPAGYNDRQVVYEGVSDDRECGACSCGQASGEFTNTLFRMWEGATCLIPQAHELEVDGECDLVSDMQGDNANAGTLLTNSNENNAACPPQLAPSTGSVEGENPVTACCV